MKSVLISAGLIALFTLSASAQAEDSTLGSTLEGLRAAGREISPALKASALDTAATAARASAAGALDDPRVEVMRDGSFGETTVSVEQDIPLWGKRGLRRRAAEGMADAARSREQAVALAFDEQLKVAYARYAAAHQALAVNEEVLRLAEGMATAARNRYAQGLGSQQEAAVAAAEVPRWLAERASLEARHRTAAARLNAMLARPAGAPLAAPSGSRRLPTAEPPFPELLERALRANPALRAGGAEVRSAVEERRLAERAWYPDLTLGAGLVERDSGSPRYKATVGVTIPLQWGVRRAGEQEAASKLGAARHRLADAEAQLEGDLTQAVADLTAARRQAGLYQRQLLPGLQLAHEAALAAYSRSRAEFAGVLDAEHRHHQARLDLLRIEVEGQTALAAVERLIGGDL